MMERKGIGRKTIGRKKLVSTVYDGATQTQTEKMHCYQERKS
jgi:hypothetical protein